jgi:hypothetical protein
MVASLWIPLHQWAQTYMGMPPVGGHAWYATDSYGVVDASKVLNWEPIVRIGVRSSHRASHQAGRPHPKRVRKKCSASSASEQGTPKNIGAPLFANNVHTWSFGNLDAPVCEKEGRTVNDDSDQ